MDKESEKIKELEKFFELFFLKLAKFNFNRVEKDEYNQEDINNIEVSAKLYPIFKLLTEYDPEKLEPSDRAYVYSTKNIINNIGKKITNILKKLEGDNFSYDFPDKVVISKKNDKDDEKKDDKDDEKKDDEKKDNGKKDDKDNGKKDEKKDDKKKNNVKDVTEYTESQKKVLKEYDTHVIDSYYETRNKKWMVVNSDDELNIEEENNKDDDDSIENILLQIKTEVNKSNNTSTNSESENNQENITSKINLDNIDLDKEIEDYINTNNLIDRNNLDNINEFVNQGTKVSKNTQTDDTLITVYLSSDDSYDEIGDDDSKIFENKINYDNPDSDENAHNNFEDIDLRDRKIVQDFLNPNKKDVVNNHPNNKPIDYNNLKNYNNNPFSFNSGNVYSTAGLGYLM